MWFLQQVLDHLDVLRPNQSSVQGHCWKLIEDEIWFGIILVVSSTDLPAKKGMQYEILPLNYKGGSWSLLDNSNIILYRINCCSVHVLSFCTTLDLIYMLHEHYASKCLSLSAQSLAFSSVAAIILKRSFSSSSMVMMEPSFLLLRVLGIRHEGPNWEIEIFRQIHRWLNTTISTRSSISIDVFAFFNERMICQWFYPTSKAAHCSIMQGRPHELASWLPSSPCPCLR